LFSKAVRGVQLVATVYMVGQPNGTRFTVAVVSNTCPGRNPGAISGTNTALEAAISSATGAEVNAFYAAFNGSNFNWND
jgi:hypothetical protein